MKPLDPPVQFIDIDGTRFAYRESGTPGKPPVVLLHGLAETSAFFWRPLIAVLEDEFHIFAFDLLGHGDSDRSSGYTTNHQAWLIAQAIEQLCVSPAFFVGHSLGGILSTLIAMNWPHLVRRLVLYDTPLPDSARNNIVTIVRNTPLKSAVLFTPLMVPFIVRLFYASMPFRLILKLALITWRIPFHRHVLDSDYLAEAERHTPHVLFENAQSIVLRTNLIKDLQKIAVPTLIIAGDSDLMVPVREARRWITLIEDASFVVVPNAGHVALLDNPAFFTKAVRQFLS